MKKAIAIFLSALLTVALLTACGEPDISGMVEPVTQATTLPAETTEPTEATEGAALEIGDLQGGVYTNTYLDITCTLDESWQYQSAQELQQFPEDLEALLQGTQVGDSLEQYSQIMDMKAENATELTSINVMFTRMSIQEQVTYALLDDETVIQGILSQRAALEESYAQAGMIVKDMKLVTAQYLGKEQPALWTHCDVQGVAYYVLQVYDYNNGRYGATVTASSFVEDKTENVLALFAPLK